MFEKLDEVEGRYAELNSMLADPSITSDPEQLMKISKEHAQLKEVVDTYKAYQSAGEELEQSKEMLAESDDDEMRQLIREEITSLEAQREELSEKLQFLLIPKDPLDEKDIFIEIRAAAGGDEAAIFVGDLFRMYSKYADQRGWRMTITDDSPSDHGGYKQIVAVIEGEDVYSRLKYEAGTHRVQRVPATESQGRIHTSTVTVAIIPEIDDEISIDVQDVDLKIDTYRASGAGGQHVNRTDSAVRITHLPSGLVVQCQNERSQHANKASAMKELKSRLTAIEIEKQRASVASDRRSQVGTGDRSERIRTYNYPQSRVTDHRITLTVHKLSQVIDGELDIVVDPLLAHQHAEALKELSQDG